MDKLWMALGDYIDCTNSQLNTFINRAFDYLIPEIKKDLENQIKSQMYQIDVTQEQIDKAMGIYTVDSHSYIEEYLKWQEYKPKKWKITRGY